MKKLFYSMKSKTFIVLLIAGVAALVGLSGTHIMRGHYIGMSLSEMVREIDYIESEEAAQYLYIEGSTIFDALQAGSYFTSAGTGYDASQTVDIMNLEAGVDNPEKNENTEYTLSDLQLFYNSESYAAIKYMLNNGGYLTMEDCFAIDFSYDSETGLITLCGDNGVTITVETDLDEDELLCMDEISIAELLEDEEMGADAVCFSTETIDLSIVAGETSSLAFQHTFGIYGNYDNMFYNNGKAAEEDQILYPASGITLADYALANQDSVSLESLYEALYSAAELLNTYLDSQEYSNALLYVKNHVTGEVYTNVNDWKTLSLDAARSAYVEEMNSSGDGYLYYSYEFAGESVAVSAGSDSLEVNGDLLYSYISDQFGTDDTYEVLLALDTTYPLNTSNSYRLYSWYKWWVEENPFGPVNAVLVFVLSALLLAVLLILSAFQTGRSPEDGSVIRVKMDRCPLEVLFFADIVFVVLLFRAGNALRINTGWILLYSEPSLSVSSAYYTNLFRSMTIAGVFLTVAAALLCTWCIKRYGRRIKARSLGGSFIAGISRSIRRTTKAMNEKENEISRTLTLFLLFVVLHFGGCLAAGVLFWDLWEASLGVILLVIIGCIDLAVLVKLLKNAAGRAEIRRGMIELSEGNLNYQVDLSTLFGENLEMGQELNGVREGVRHAVDTEMKSERLKTDLITNVSHDIKTPLTSIINYVDILKRENISDERIAGYIDVLDRKSARLQQLTDDLVEVSKISSGTLSLDMQPLNVKQLILQAAGEFEEKLKERQLQLMMQLPEEDLRICADGRRMYRVIENLFQNVVKYAMPGSRVYVFGERTDDTVVFSVKNMSEQPLNFQADELLERFVRGDVSRSSEGSGLGLEIAKSLTAMQGGTFDLYMDGDLFKVTVTFAAL